MVLQYLGTAAAEGWPGMFCSCDVCEMARERGGRNIRTRSQALVFANKHGEGGPNERILIDLTPDTYLHYLTHNVELNKIGHMIVTHSHNDHFLPSELKYRGRIYSVKGVDFKMQVYGNEDVIGMCKDFVDNAIVGTKEQYDFHIAENFEPFAVGDFTVTALPANHARNERCLNYIIEHDGKRLLYGNDTGIFKDETWEYIKGTQFDLISLDCTFGVQKEGTNHMGLPDIIEMKAKFAELECLKPGTRIIINHFSHNGGACYDEMVELAAPHGFEVSYDGGIWEI